MASPAPSRPQVTSPFPRRRGALPANYWQRVGAALVDGLIFVVTVALPATLAVWWFGDAGLTLNCEARGTVEVCPPMSAGDRALSRSVFYGLGIVYVLWYARGIGRGRSVGKRATEYKVVDRESGQVIGFGRGLLRTVAIVASVAPFGLGLLWPLWDRERRTFHDMIARTRAISP